MKKTLFTISLGTTLMAAVMAAPPARPMPVVAVDTVKAADNVEQRRYSGLVVSPAVVQLMPRVSGELLEIGFKDGETVRKGQMLYRFDTIRYEAAVKSAEAKIAECKARLEYAQNSYNRANTLYASQAASKDSLENTLSSMEAYKSALLAAEAALITAKDDLKNTVIVAPMNGVIGVTNFSVGNYITPSSGELCSINQIDPIRVKFSISNRDFLMLFGSLENLRKYANIKLKLADDTFYVEPGSVELIDNEANRRTDTIQVYARFSNKSQKLIPGSTVAVHLSRLTGKALPAIMPSAIMHDAQTAYVYALDKDNKVFRRNVTLGNDLGNLVIVTQGLKVGDRVVVDGTHKTMPGATVEPQMVK